ncbi:hypothetical protein U9M48_000856 [Paspalum notatum var. saurae]|uniref:Transposase n=1 Tax=Paspalum notatum var. saurae TaxID=547442 RepID=A0AAQ3SHP6_PASNO
MGEGEEQAELLGLAVGVEVMDLDPIAEEEEHRLKDHNEAADARGFMGFSETHGDPNELDGVPVSDPGTGTATASSAPAGSAAVAPSRRRKRSKCWNDFDELTKVVNGKTVRFVHVSRQTTARDMIKLYNDRKAGKAKEDYLSVVGHFVNSKWELEKRLFGLRLIDGKHSGVNIANVVATVIDDYALTDKVFAITLDNASSNNTAMKYLRPFLSGYLGVPAPVLPETPNDDDTHTPSDDDDLSTMFLHQRCCCHVINLGVKAGLDPLKAYVDDFRTAITFLNASNQRIAAYKSYCMSMAVRPRKFGVDMDVRWNSTCLMLKHLVPYKSTFSVFIKTQYPLNRDGTPLLTDNHWLVAEKILSFLELFYESTVALSGVYYPTAPLMVHHILRIARHLNAYENDPLLRCAVVPMKDKFLKFPIDVCTKLTKVFNMYESKFGDERQRAAHQPGAAHGSGKKKMAWGDIYDDDDDIGGFPSTPLGRTPGSSTSSPHALSTVASTSELASYLDSDILTEFDEDFNILSWVIEECRHRLTLDMVEVLSCIKDWELADTHLQHSVEEETQELEEVHENMYLDVDDAAEDEG